MNDKLAACIKISEEVVKGLKANGYAVLEEGEYPSTAIDIGGTHLLLVRYFGPTFTISLPSKEAFDYRSMEDLAVGMRTIAEGVAAYRVSQPKVFTIADAVLKLRPAVVTLDPAWTLDIPGTPTPSEAWLNSEKYSIGLFQEDATVRVIVWVGSDMRLIGINTPERLVELPGWVISHLKDQVVTNVRLAEEEKKRAAIEPPPIEKAMAALARGKRIQLGSGRWYVTYFIADGKLRCGVSDEGYYDEEDATEEQFSESMKGNAEQAQEQIRDGA
ncbi:MAG: hypothetical protein ABIO72_03305 [Patescibacteria group bacterium]